LYLKMTTPGQPQFSVITNLVCLLSVVLILSGFGAFLYATWTGLNNLVPAFGIMVVVGLVLLKIGMSRVEREVNKMEN